MLAAMSSLVNIVDDRQIELFKEFPNPSNHPQNETSGRCNDIVECLGSHHGIFLRPQLALMVRLAARDALGLLVTVSAAGCWAVSHAQMTRFEMTFSSWGCGK